MYVFFSFPLKLVMDAYHNLLSNVHVSLNWRNNDNYSYENLTNDINAWSYTYNSQGYIRFRLFWKYAEIGYLG